tara:strand:- start:67 stop:543 length:477 start_codon:yes stop_codon:yes gene_type:complete
MDQKNTIKKNRKMKKIIFIILVSIISGCASKKTIVEYKDRLVIDTISIFKDRIISKQVIDTLVIESPCDTLGNLKDFEKTIKTEIVEIKLINNKGNIQATVNIDSVQQVWEKKFKNSFKRDTKIKEVEIIRNKIPFWIIILLIASFGFNILLLRRFLL